MLGVYTRRSAGKLARSVMYRLRGIPPDLAYWHERAARLVRPDSLVSDTEADSRLYRDSLKEIFRRTPLPDGPDLWAVDFGCGTGRFTAHFAEVTGGPAMGVDPVAPMLARAQPMPGVRFELIRDGWAPLEDASARLVTLIHVLGGLWGDALKDVVRETTRLLAPGGVLFVVEAAEGGDSAHWRGRTASYYCKLWKEVPLQLMRTVRQANDDINVMWGTKC